MREEHGSGEWAGRGSRARFGSKPLERALRRQDGGVLYNSLCRRPLCEPDRC